MPSSAVLDASAMMAVLLDEPGGRELIRVLPNAVVSAVNLSEVAGKLFDRGANRERVEAILDGLKLGAVDGFGAEAAVRAGELRHSAPRYLSLGDRACIELAIRSRLPAYTADRSWAGLKLIGLKVVSIR